ncbi:MAG: Ig-like domain-containing protein, partial [Patescibacteria group bacterium]
NFYGSGSLGTVIKDHYPNRDQIDVPLNTKIIISFRPAVSTTFFITDTSGNGILGDCKNIGDSNFVWQTDCDTLKPSIPGPGGVDLIDIKRGDTGALIRGANVLASYENGKVYTIVIRPFDYLGSDTEKIPYTVRIGKGVLTDDPANGNKSVFEGFPSGRDCYEWNFTCDTKLDVTPPHVVDVFPARTSTEAKNTAIQITFDKAMDPTTVQGSFSDGTGADANAYILNGSSVFIKKSTNIDTVPLGNFRLVNNYRTMEFASSVICGQNACGGNVYCMPVADGAIASYELLLRAGRAFSATSFEAMPFSGVMDASGNALDGDADGQVDRATYPPLGAVFDTQKVPDNYFGWTFALEDRLDLVPPFINNTTPGPNATFVLPNDEWSMVFSKRMLNGSLYEIGISVSPATIDPPCRSPRVGDVQPDGTVVSVRADGSQKVLMSHCGFVTNQTRIYYIPIVDSRVQDAHYNCLYPGKGPNALIQNSNNSVVCDSANPTNCCAVDNNTNPFCCNGLASNDSRQTCLDKLK